VCSKKNIEARRTVIRALSNTISGVEPENRYEVFACLSGKMRGYNMRALLGDEAPVELLPYHPSMGRIVQRKRRLFEGL
jgi:translation initiation factor IF-1